MRGTCYNYLLRTALCSFCGQQIEVLKRLHMLLPDTPAGQAEGGCYSSAYSVFEGSRALNAFHYTRTHDVSAGLRICFWIYKYCRLFAGR